MPRPILCCAILAGFAAAAGCGGESASLVTIRNDFSSARFTLVEVTYRDGRWTTTIGRGEQSAAQSTTPGLSYGYALAVWDYDAAASPAQLPLVIRTKSQAESIADTPVDIVFSEANHVGKCAGVTQSEYEEIADGQFPGSTVQAYGDIACP